SSRAALRPGRGERRPESQQSRPAQAERVIDQLRGIEFAAPTGSAVPPAQCSRYRRTARVSGMPRADNCRRHVEIEKQAERCGELLRRRGGKLEVEAHFAGSSIRTEQWQGAGAVQFARPAMMSCRNLDAIVGNRQAQRGTCGRETDARPR